MSPSPPSILRNSLSSPSLPCLALISAFLAWTSLSLRKSGRDLTALIPEACARSREEPADFIGDLSCDIDVFFLRAEGSGLGIGFETLKLFWKRTLSRVDAVPNGSVVGSVEVFLGGRAGNGLGASGLIVACMRANEDAVGAYSLELGTVAVVLGRLSSVGGGGAGRAFLKVSA